MYYDMVYVCCDIMPYVIIRYDMLSYDMICYVMISYDMMWYVISMAMTMTAANYYATTGLYITGGLSVPASSGGVKFGLLVTGGMTAKSKGKKEGEVLVVGSSCQR